MTEAPVIFSETKVAAGFIGFMRLNQPALLNSLNLEMIQLLTARFLAWREDENCLAVYLSGSGDRAFCAGGDIQALYRSMLHGTDYCRRFFAAEYRLDHLIRFYPKPVICAGQGAVMGGGLGLMSGSSHRIVTPSSRIALPEITIGLFPDASATFYLAAMPGYLADFISLTGSRLTGLDAIQAGFADHLLAEDRLADLPEELWHLDWQRETEANRQLLDAELGGRNEAAESGLADLTPLLRELEGLLAAEGPAAYLAALEERAEESSYLQTAAQNLAAGCPVTAWVIREQLRRARDMDYSSMLRMEYDVATTCSEQGDFQEGVRALLIDKDRQPKWRFPELADVPAEQVARHFEEAAPHPLQDLTDAWTVMLSSPGRPPIMQMKEQND